MLNVRKVRVGYRTDTYGTIEVTPQGLRYDGPNVPRMRELVESITGPKDPAQMPGGMEGLLGYLVGPGVNNGYWWVSPIEPTTEQVRAMMAEQAAQRGREG